MSRRNLFPTMSAAQVVSRIGKTTKRRNPMPEDVEVFEAGESLTAYRLEDYLWHRYSDEVHEANDLGRVHPALALEVLTVLYDFGVISGPDRPTPTSSEDESWTTTMSVSGDTFNVAVRAAMDNFRRDAQTNALADQLVARVYGAPVTPAPAPAPKPAPAALADADNTYYRANTALPIREITNALSQEYEAEVDEAREYRVFLQDLARMVERVLIRTGFVRLGPTGAQTTQRITKAQFTTAVNTALKSLRTFQPLESLLPAAVAPAPAPKPAPTMAQQLAQAAFGGGRSRTAPAPAPAPQADREFPQNITLFGRDAEIAYEDFIPDLEVHYAASVDTAMRNGLSSRQFAKAVVKELAKLDMVEDRGYIKVLRAIQGYHVTEAVNRARNSILPESERPKPLALPRSPATSAYAFPKRCEGVSRPASREYMFTLIAPLCKMPLRFGADASNHKYYGDSPDLTKEYVGGYHGTYDFRMFNGMSFMRQHMLPGVINEKDFGKGVGPACYMAGPLRVATLNDSLAGTFSPVGGRSGDADAAWYNLVQHKTAVQELINAKEVTLKTYGLLNFATKADPNYHAKRPDDVAPIVAKTLGQIQPAKLTVQAADAIYDYIYRKHILGLGIVLHIDPKHEQKILAGMNLTAPIVPPPGIWSELDLSQTDTNSLGEFLHYCSSNFAKYGNLTAGDYMRGALEALKQNPSSPMSDEELKTELAQYKPAKSVVQRKKRNPEVDADLSQETRLLSDFLNDEDWGEGGSVQNPAPRTFIPPPAVAAEARKGITLRASQPPSNRCCTPVGLRRAVQLANRQPVSETTLRRMKAYFDRHYGPDSRGKGWGVDSRGWQAHLCWGGDAGRKWVESILGGR